MRRVTCPHCGGHVGVPWEEVDPLLRQGRLTLVEVASRYGTSADWLRQRCRRLGLPPRPTPAPPGADWLDEAGAVAELRASRARCEEAMDVLRALLADRLTGPSGGM